MSLDKLEGMFLILMDEYEGNKVFSIDFQRVYDDIQVKKGKEYGEIQYLLTFKDKENSLRVEMFDYPKKSDNYQDGVKTTGYEVVLNKTKTDSKSNWEYQEYKSASSVSELNKAITEFSHQL